MVAFRLKSIRFRRKGISKEEREIELANYIEDVTAAVVGAEYTDAFFRCLLEVERS